MSGMIQVGGLSAVLNLDSKGFNVGLISANAALKTFTKSVGTANTAIANLAALGSGVFLGQLAGDAILAGENMMKLNLRLTAVESGLNAVSQQAIKVGSSLEWVYETANRTGTAFDGMAKTFTQIAPIAASQGVALDTVKNSIVGVIGAAQLMGSSSEEISRAFLAIRQVIGKDSLQMEELRQQLGEAMPNAMLILVRGLNQLKTEGFDGLDTKIEYTTVKLMQMMQNNEINGRMFMEALERGTKDFQRFAELRVMTLEGQMVTFKNIMDRRIGDIVNNSQINTWFGVLLAEMNNTLDTSLTLTEQQAKELGDKVRELFTDIASSVADFFGKLSNTFGPLANEIKRFLEDTVGAAYDFYMTLPEDVREYGLLAMILLGPKLIKNANWIAGIGFAAYEGWKNIFREQTQEEKNRTQSDNIETLALPSNRTFGLDIWRQRGAEAFAQNYDLDLNDTSRWFDALQPGGIGAAQALKEVDQLSATIRRRTGIDQITAGSGPMKYAPLLEAAGRKYGITPDLLYGLMMKESSGDPNAVGPDVTDKRTGRTWNARGLMQFSPDTAARFGVDVNDPESSIMGAARYLRELFDQTGDMRRALAIYGGHDKVDPTGYINPILASAKEYASKVSYAPGSVPAKRDQAAAEAAAAAQQRDDAQKRLRDAQGRLNELNLYARRTQPERISELNDKIIPALQAEVDNAEQRRKMAAEEAALLSQEEESAKKRLEGLENVRVAYQNLARTGADTAQSAGDRVRGALEGAGRQAEKTTQDRKDLAASLNPDAIVSIQSHGGEMSRMSVDQLTKFFETNLRQLSEGVERPTVKASQALNEFSLSLMKGAENAKLYNEVAHDKDAQGIKTPDGRSITLANLFSAAAEKAANALTRLDSNLRLPGQAEEQYKANRAGLESIPDQIQNAIQSANQKAPGSISEAETRQLKSQVEELVKTHVEQLDETFRMDSERRKEQADREERTRTNRERQALETQVKAIDEATRYSSEGRNSLVQRQMMSPDRVQAYANLEDFEIQHGTRDPGNRAFSLSVDEHEKQVIKAETNRLLFEQKELELELKIIGDDQYRTAFEMNGALEYRVSKEQERLQLLSSIANLRDILGDSDRVAEEVANYRLSIEQSILETKKNSAEIEAMLATSDGERLLVDQATGELHSQVLDLKTQIAAMSDQAYQSELYKTEELQSQLALLQLQHDYQQSISSSITSSLVPGIQSFTQKFSSGLTNVVLGMQSVKQVGQDLFKSLIQGVIQFFIQWMVQQAAAWLLSKALGLLGVTTATTQAAVAGAAAAAAWAPAATAASIASWGAAAAAGTAALAAAMPMGIAIVTGASLLGGAAGTANAGMGMTGAMGATMTAHTGAYVSGMALNSPWPMKLAADEVPAVLQTGEIVVSRSLTPATLAAMTLAGLPLPPGSPAPSSTLISQLAERDRMVRGHEASHLSTGSSLLSSPTFSMQRGPDGRMYALSGSIGIGSNLSNSPTGALLALRNAALAPSQLSAQDIAVANNATMIINKRFAALQSAGYPIGNDLVGLHDGAIALHSPSILAGSSSYADNTIEAIKASSGSARTGQQSNEQASQSVEVINYFSWDEVDRHLTRNPAAVLNIINSDKRNRGSTTR